MKNRQMLKIPYLLLCTMSPIITARAQIQNMRGDVWCDPQRISRSIPTTAADHPGNVFLAGESVTVRLPHEISGQAVFWQVLDDANNVVARGSLRQGTSTPLSLGDLRVGWYRADFLDTSGKVVSWTATAVLSRLVGPTPQDSPICVDSATSWFAPNDPPRQERFAYLAALAGMNWVRDRISWGGAQSGPETFAQDTSYDSAATLQAKHGLKVLQVFHDTPGWATNRELDGERASGRFPRDLRHLYKFSKAIAQRYEGRVLAWEPWNEANITVFGGHTIDEMCTHQKVACLAFKAANQNLTVCWNVYAGSGTSLHAQGVLENEVWPYFETYNIHTYSKPDDYLNEFAPARQAACGRPIWLTECGIWPALADRPSRERAIT